MIKGLKSNVHVTHADAADAPGLSENSRMRAHASNVPASLVSPPARVRTRRTDAVAAANIGGGFDHVRLGWLIVRCSPIRNRRPFKTRQKQEASRGRPTGRAGGPLIDDACKQASEHATDGDPIEGNLNELSFAGKTLE